LYSKLQSYQRSSTKHFNILYSFTTFQ